MLREREYVYRFRDEVRVGLHGRDWVFKWYELHGNPKRALQRLQPTIWVSMLVWGSVCMSESKMKGSSITCQYLIKFRLST